MHPAPSLGVPRWCVAIVVLTAAVSVGLGLAIVQRTTASRPPSSSKASSVAGSAVVVLVTETPAMALPSMPPNRSPLTATTPPSGLVRWTAVSLTNVSVASDRVETSFPRATSPATENLDGVVSPTPRREEAPAAPTDALFEDLARRMEGGFFRGCHDLEGRFPPMHVPVSGTPLLWRWKTDEASSTAPSASDNTSRRSKVTSQQDVAERKGQQEKTRRCPGAYRTLWRNENATIFDLFRRASRRIRQAAQGGGALSSATTAPASGTSAGPSSSNSKQFQGRTLVYLGDSTVRNVRDSLVAASCNRQRWYQCGTLRLAPREAFPEEPTSLRCGLPGYPPSQGPFFIPPVTREGERPPSTSAASSATGDVVGEPINICSVSVEQQSVPVKGLTVGDNFTYSKDRRQRLREKGYKQPIHIATVTDPSGDHDGDFRVASMDAVCRTSNGPWATLNYFLKYKPSLDNGDNATTITAYKEREAAAASSSIHRDKYALGREKFHSLFGSPGVDFVFVSSLFHCTEPRLYSSVVRWLVESMIEFSRYIAPVVWMQPTECFHQRCDRLQGLSDQISDELRKAAAAWPSAVDVAVSASSSARPLWGPHRSLRPDVLPPPRVWMAPQKYIMNGKVLAEGCPPGDQFHPSVACYPTILDSHLNALTVLYDIYDL